MMCSTLALLTASLTLASPKTITNPLGFTYQLPTGWSVVATQDVYQVLKRPGQGENELYIMGGSIEFEAKTSWDKRLQDEDLEMMKSLGPWRQNGGAQSFDAKSGKGMIMKFVGSNEGVDFQGELWSLVAGKKRFGILAIYPIELAATVYPSFFSISKSMALDASRTISTNNAHAKAWSEKLAGNKLVLNSANNAGSLNGGAGDSVSRTYVFLKDGTFQYFMRSMSFISAGEFSGTSESNDQAIGRWSIQSDGRTVILVLQPNGKPAERFTLTTRGNYILMNGRVFNRVKI